MPRIENITYKTVTKVFLRTKDSEMADEHLATITVDVPDPEKYHFDIIEWFHHELKRKFPEQIQEISLEDIDENELYYQSEHLAIVEREDSKELIYLDGRFTGNLQKLEQNKWMEALEERSNTQ